MTKTTFAAAQLTAAHVDTLVGKALVEFYNDIAEALGQDPTRRFATSAIGQKRAKDLVSQYKSRFPAVTAAPKAAKAPKVAATSDRRRGTNIIPLGQELEPCREGSKQSILVDLLSSKNGATMPELIRGLSGGKKPWQEITVRAGFGWDLKNKGYGVRSSFDEDGTERFHLVLPEKFPRIPAHTPLKGKSA